MSSFFHAGRGDLRVEARLADSDGDSVTPVVVTGYHVHYPLVALHLTPADAQRLQDELATALREHHRREQGAAAEPGAAVPA